MIDLTVPMPGLDAVPEGTHRDLLESLHRLYRAAGLPGLRRISDEIRDRDEFSDTVSPETVSNLLNGSSIPRWSKLEPVVVVLARKTAHDVDVAAAVTGVRDLWLATQDGALEQSISSQPEDSSGVLVYPPGLIVASEEVRLRYVGSRYEYSVERLLYNDGAEPVREFDIKISVDRYPSDSGRSLDHHRRHPLSWDEMSFDASCEDEPLDWKPMEETERIKIVRLRFSNDGVEFPIMPGRKRKISYTCMLTDDQWGRWIQRSIRLETTSLIIRLDLPSELQPIVWSLMMDPAGNPSFRTRRRPTVKHGRSHFAWQPTEVTKNWMYRLEWSLS